MASTTFDLDDDQGFHEQVDSISEVEFLSFVNHGQTDLCVHVEASLAEFVGQAGVVGTLQQTRAKDGVHFHRGTDNGGGDFVHLKCGNYRWDGHRFSFRGIPISLLQALL
jgi:hypothetical protein